MNLPDIKEITPLKLSILLKKGVLRIKQGKLEGRDKPLSGTFFYLRQRFNKEIGVAIVHHQWDCRIFRFGHEKDWEVEEFLGSEEK